MSSKIRIKDSINSNDYVSYREGFLKNLVMECPFAEEKFNAGNPEGLAEHAFQDAMVAFKRKTEQMQAVAQSVIKQVQEEQGDRFEHIAIPITDGKRVYQVSFNPKEAYDTEAKDVVKQFEKSVVLHIIDENWKGNLQQLDGLRHSIQNASYKQKGPLLIFKLESAKLWDSMINDMNNQTTSISMRGQIPETQQEEVHEAAPVQRSQRYNEQKDDLTDPSQTAAAHRDTHEQARQVNRAPYVKSKMPRPNDPCPCGSSKKFRNCHGRNLR